MLKKVSLIIPIYNEEDHLKAFLEEIDALNLSAEKELIFVDDFSLDNSKIIIKEFEFKSQMRLIEQSANYGKGVAVWKGIEEATGDILGVQDADFEYDMNEIPELIKPIIADKADVVYGSRFKKTGTQVHRTFHYLGNRFLTLASNLLSGLYLSDMETCYKFFKAEIIKNINLESRRFGFEPEITAKIARLKVRVVELPISYFPRSYMEGKKITWKDGVAALWHIITFNLLRKPQQCYKAQMPKQYLIGRTLWL